MSIHAEKRPSAVLSLRLLRSTYFVACPFMGAFKTPINRQTTTALHLKLFAVPSSMRDFKSASGMPEQVGKEE